MELGVGDDLDFACFCLSVFLVFLSVCFGTKVKVLGVFRKGRRMWFRMGYRELTGD